MNYDRLENDNQNLNTYWDIAIGLQKVDDLEPSNYLYELKDKNISNVLSNDQIEDLLYEKYKDETKDEIEQRKKECDIVSNRMVKILSSKGSFRLIPENFALFHGLLFKDIFEQLEEKYVGKFRDFNISKKEPILNGKSVIYSDYNEIKSTLEYDMHTEREIDYNLLYQHEVIDKITNFTSRIWQVHPFIEGNTRTTAIFIQKHLNQIGFNINNDMFSQYAKYFRNALVRANYYNRSLNVDPNEVYLKKFFVNLLYNGNYELSNKDLIVKECFYEESVDEMKTKSIINSVIDNSIEDNKKNNSIEGNEDDGRK